MDGYEALREVVRTLPVPGAPPRTSIPGAAVGLSFLDTVLRLNHVRRLTDRLTIVEHASARRTTEVDIDLGMLDENQREAARLYQQLVGQSKYVDMNNTTATMWVPVARISRRSVAPVDVLDGAGQKLPKLTQYETSRLLASALFHLFRGILTGTAQARTGGSALNRFLSKDHEARWLIQAALQTLLTDRTRPQKPRVATAVDSANAHRGLALEILDDNSSLLVDYRSLLDIAVEEYLLVVGLDGRRDEHLLTYESPMTVRGVRHLSTFAPNIRANSRGYVAEYRSTVPANLRSFHVVVDTEHGVDIDRMFLSTDADNLLVKEVAEDLRVLADRLEEHRKRRPGVPAEPVLRLAVETVVRHVAGLWRRRQWDADQAEVLLADDELGAVSKLAEAAASEEIANSPGTAQENSVLDPEDLRSAARVMAKYEVGHDLALENDPVSSRAHAYWRRDAGWQPNGTSQIDICAGMILRDTNAIGPVNVFVYTVSMTIVSYGLAILLAGHPFPYFGAVSEIFGRIENREAVIAVLLLVPGFLYTRLSLPEKHSVAGYLRRFPRLVAQLCIAMMAAVAAAVAASSPGSVVAVLFLLSVVVPLAFASWAFAGNFRGQRRAVQRTTESGEQVKRAIGKELWLLGAPGWLRRDLPVDAKRWTPDVSFGSRLEQADE